MKKPLLTSIVTGSLMLTMTLVVSAADDDAAASAAPAASADPSAASEIEWLFVQNATGGTLSEADDGGYQLTLEGVSADTIAFSDTPYQEVETLSTADVTDIINGATDKPNAALQVISPDAVTVVLTLESGTYDADAGSLTYAAEVLADGSLGDITPDGDLPTGDLLSPTLFIDGESGLAPGNEPFQVGSQCKLTPADKTTDVHCWTAKKGDENWAPMYSAVKVTFRDVTDIELNGSGDGDDPNDVTPVAVHAGCTFLGKSSGQLDPGIEGSITLNHSKKLCASSVGVNQDRIIEIVSIKQID